MEIDPDILARDLEKAAEEGLAVRGHVGGDFYNRGAADRPYLDALDAAFAQAARLPTLWFFTHAWRDPIIGRFARTWRDLYGIQVLASVHTPTEAREAHALGFRCAIDLGDGLSIQDAASVEPVVPDYSGEAVRALVCPAQRLGHEAMRCADCLYCGRPGAADVGFLRH